MFARKNAAGRLELVLLDHGIFASVSDEGRLAYTRLWRGILDQDTELIRDACRDLNVTDYEMFTQMVTSRKFEDVMREDATLSTKSRTRNSEYVLLPESS